MTHYCPLCHRALPENPMTAHHCPPNPADRIPGPDLSPASLRRRALLDRAVDAVFKLTWTGLIIGLAWLIVYAPRPY